MAAERNFSSNLAEPLAIVGLSFKLPQDVVDEASLWKILEERKSLLTDWPQDRVCLDGFYKGGHKEPNMLPTRGIHALKEDPAVFDAPFFSITAKEASSMDPQQRWALEAAYHAFENGERPREKPRRTVPCVQQLTPLDATAGIASENLRGSHTAVFSATFADDFARILAKDPDVAPLQAILGSTPSILPNRISWYFGLRGPSMHIDTACSGSMVAMDMACQSILSGNATAALVIGSNIMLSPENSVLLANMNFLSPSGRCFSFDERANGYSRGEGVLAVVIKPLADALSSGDVVRAVVRSTASNHDGRTPILTQPSAEAQEALIRDAYRKAGLGFESTRYVEAHGTGTPVGDPIEMSAIGKVFGPCRSPHEPLFVGSIKANIGHAEGGSGLAAIMKAILMLEKGIIPPNALFERLNPGIDAVSYNLQVPTRSIPWPMDGLRRISINSFGVGGANSHVILDDAYHFLQEHRLSGFHHCDTGSTGHAVGTVDSDTAINGYTDNEAATNGFSVGQPSPRLLIWSAADSGAINRMSQAYQSYYQAQVVKDRRKLDQLAYTLARRRSVMPWRTFAVAGGVYADSGRPPLTFALPVRASPEKASIGLIFTGQGAQYVEMGLQLLQFPAFEASLQLSNVIFANLGAEWSVLDALRNHEDIDLPQVSQPLCTALQIALVDLLRSFGVSPVGVVGHSSGEAAAAYTIGALSQRSACKVSYCRGQLAGKFVATTTIPGAMISVNVAEAEIPSLREKLGLTTEDNTVHVACVNSPTNVTLSGPAGSIKVVQGYLDEQGVFAKTVNTGVAYHSPAMRAITTEYRASIGFLEPGNTPKISGNTRSLATIMVSSVTGDVVNAELLSMPDYWVNNLVSPVRFVDALERLTNKVTDPSFGFVAGDITDLIEIGPHAALRRPVKDTVPSVRYHAILERSKPDVQNLLSVIGSLFCHGHPLSVAAANGQANVKLQCLTDCPPYPFDHSRRYWSESRIARGYRMRKSTPAYLLGRRAQDWNELRPRWRNWLSLETHPWLGDHCVDGVAVCPGAGMVVMAVEAVKQMTTGEDRIVAAYLVKEARFLSPVVIGESSQESTETELHVLPMEHGGEEDASWYETRIFTFRQNSWAECFHATISVCFEPNSTDSVDGGREQHLAHEKIQERVKQTTSACKEPLHPDRFYSFNRENIGLDFKSSFQNLAKLDWDGYGTFSARVDIASASRHYQILDSPVHPAVLDSCVQPNLAQISRGLSRTRCPTMVAHSVEDMWIAARVWDRATDSVHLGSFAKNINDKTRQFEASACGVADDGSVLFSVGKVVMAEISRPDEALAEQTCKSLYQIAMKPRLSSLHGKALQEHLSASDFDNTDETTLGTPIAAMECLMRTAARRGLREIPPTERRGASTHLQKYATLLEKRYALVRGDEDEENLTTEELHRRLDECEAAEPGFYMFPLVARALPSLLRGKTDPLELLFNSGAAGKFYNYLTKIYSLDRRLFEFISLAAHEKPALRIIEVGAGTGAMTRAFLASLRELEEKTGRECFYEFTYTDISPAFFEAARAEFAEFRGRMSFKTLDLERDIGSQGFESGSYDMAIASNVFHATSNLGRTLTNVRRLLRHGGRLMFHEAVVPDSACFNVGFGCLEGWLLATEPWRQLGPLAYEEQWDEVLRTTGFSGIDASLWDHQSEASHVSSTMISEAIPPTLESNFDAQDRANKTWLLTDPNSHIQESLASELGRRIQHTEVIHLTHVCSREWAISSFDHVISLLELGSSFLASISETEFAAFKTLFARVQNLLWVAAPQHDNDPHTALVVGFMRTLRSEESGKHLVTLLYQSPFKGTSDARFVSEIHQLCFEGSPPCFEEEFVVCQGKVTIGRLERAVHVQNQCLARIQPQQREARWPSGPSPGLALDIGTPGMLDTLRFVEDMRPPALNADEVEIQAAACGVSSRDVQTALGRLGEEQQMGLGCAGTVVRLGAGCANLQIGDRVLAAVPGCMRSHPRAPAQVVCRIPDGLSFSEAAAALAPGMMAYHSLLNVAHVRPGHKVLIHAAAGATGQMMIAIGQTLGAEVFATVDSREKKDFLIEHLGISTEHIFYSGNTSFVPGIMRVTNGAGVDVVVNSLPGESLQASWKCVAPYGHFIEIGKADIQANSAMPTLGFAKNVSFTAVDILHIAQTNHELTRELTETTITHAVGGHKGAAPVQLFGASQIEQAFRLVQSGANTGRVVLTLSPEEVVPRYTTLKSDWRFREDGSYLVAGGLGGLGQAILKWMADKGARHLIVPSRSGPSSPEAIDTIADLTKRGVQVLAPRCDVSLSADLEPLLQDCATIMPPVKGCINATMALHDSVFENMTHSQWALNIQSKVHTSWNLHQLLPKDMDFFILLSSLMGIYENPSQSNYAAGCVFQDTLARLRSAQGMRGSISLDIGYMRSVGYAARRSAESEVVRANARKLAPIETEELLEILDHYCDPALPLLDETHSQLLIGARTAGDYAARGEEPLPATLRALFAGFNNPRDQDASLGRADVARDIEPSQLFRQAGDAEERQAVVTAALRAKVARALGVTVEDVEGEKTLADYGTDSLMAVELRSWIRKDFGAEITVFDMTSDKSIKAVGELVAAKVGAATIIQ